MSRERRRKKARKQLRAMLGNVTNIKVEAREQGGDAVCIVTSSFSSEAAMLRAAALMRRAGMVGVSVVKS